MKYMIKEAQNPRKKVLTIDGVRLNLIGRGSLGIKEKAEKLIGELMFYKLTSDGQIIKSLNGASPYINYYLSEDNVKTLKLHDRNRFKMDALLLEK